MALFFKTLLVILFLTRCPLLDESWLWSLTVIDGEAPVQEFWVSLEYTFIAITPRSTLT